MNSNNETELDGLPSTIMPPPAVTLTFERLTPQSNQHIYESIYICDQNWVRFHSVVFEIWCSQGFRNAPTLAHLRTDTPENRFLRGTESFRWKRHKKSKNGHTVHYVRACRPDDVKELNFCWNNYVYRKIFQMNVRESAKQIQFFCDRLDFIHILHKNRMYFLCRMNKNPAFAVWFVSQDPVYFQNFLVYITLTLLAVMLVLVFDNFSTICTGSGIIRMMLYKHIFKFLPQWRNLLLLPVIHSGTAPRFWKWAY